MTVLNGLVAQMMERFVFGVSNGRSFNDSRLCKVSRRNKIFLFHFIFFFFTYPVSEYSYM